MLIWSFKISRSDFRVYSRGQLDFYLKFYLDRPLVSPQNSNLRYFILCSINQLLISIFFVDKLWEIHLISILFSVVCWKWTEYHEPNSTWTVWTHSASRSRSQPITCPNPTTASKWFAPTNISLWPEARPTNSHSSQPTRSKYAWRIAPWQTIAPIIAVDSLSILSATCLTRATTKRRLFASFSTLAISGTKSVVWSSALMAYWSELKSHCWVMYPTVQFFASMIDWFGSRLDRVRRSRLLSTLTMVLLTTPSARVNIMRSSSASFTRTSPWACSGLRVIWTCIVFKVSSVS